MIFFTQKETVIKNDAIDQNKITENIDNITTYIPIDLDKTKYNKRKINKIIPFYSDEIKQSNNKLILSKIISILAQNSVNINSTTLYKKQSTSEQWNEEVKTDFSSNHAGSTSLIISDLQYNITEYNNETYNNKQDNNELPTDETPLKKNKQISISFNVYTKNNE